MNTSALDLPSSSVCHAAEHRVTGTPNATMTTLASPTLTGTTDLCLWIVEFAAGASGPEHAMDSEQIWRLDHGVVRCILEATEYRLEAGDVLRVAGGILRRFEAESDARFTVCGLAGAVAMTSTNLDGVVPPWIA